MSINFIYAVIIYFSVLCLPGNKIFRFYQLATVKLSVHNT